MKWITFGPERSKSISALGYDEQNKTLGVKFKNGGEYHYPDVTPEQHENALNAPSIGRHLRANIIGNPNHPHTKVK